MSSRDENEPKVSAVAAAKLIQWSIGCGVVGMLLAFLAGYLIGAMP